MLKILHIQVRKRMDILSVSVENELDTIEIIPSDLIKNQ